MEASHWLFLGVGGPVVIIGSALLEQSLIMIKVPVKAQPVYLDRILQNLVCWMVMVLGNNHAKLKFIGPV